MRDTAKTWGDLRAAAECGLRTAFVNRPLEWGAARESKPPPAGRFDIRATDLLDLDRQLDEGGVVSGFRCRDDRRTQLET